MVLTLIRDDISPQAAAFVVLCFAALMISRVQLPEVAVRGALGVAFFIGFWSYMLVIMHPTWFTIGLWNAWNLVILLIARFQERKLQASEV